MLFKHTQICLILFVAVFFTGSILSTGHTKEIFTINTADKPPYSTKDNTGVYDKIISSIFEDIGIKIKINHLLSARSIENVQVGLDDAEYARIKGLSKTYSNLIIVNENLLDFSFTAFSKDSSIKIENWESLEKYNIGFMQGWKIYEKNVKAKSVLIVSSENELFQVLEKGRVDIILYELLRGMDYMKKNNISGIVDLKPAVSTRGMYLYVNKKHKKLVPDIESRLRLFKTNYKYRNILEAATSIK